MMMAMIAIRITPTGTAMATARVDTGKPAWEGEEGVRGGPVGGKGEGVRGGPVGGKGEGWEVDQEWEGEGVTGGPVQW